MTIVTTGAVKLFYEETGVGTPLVFLHEFAGDHRSWSDQVRHFSRELSLLDAGGARLSAVVRARE